MLKIQRWKDLNGNGYLQGVRHAAPYGDHFSLLWRPFWIQNGRQNTKSSDLGKICFPSSLCSCELIIIIVFGIGNHIMILQIISSAFTLNFLSYKPTGPVSSNIYRTTINSTGPNLKTTLMTINSNHQNSKHDDVPNIMWTCQLCIR